MGKVGGGDGSGGVIACWVFSMSCRGAARWEVVSSELDRELLSLSRGMESKG